jgi:hypothetical protein
MELADEKTDLILNVSPDMVKDRQYELTIITIEDID